MKNLTITRNGVEMLVQEHRITKNLHILFTINGRQCDMVVDDPRGRGIFMHADYKWVEDENVAIEFGYVENDGSWEVWTEQVDCLLCDGSYREFVKGYSHTPRLNRLCDWAIRTAEAYLRQYVDNRGYQVYTTDEGKRQLATPRVFDWEDDAYDYAVDHFVNFEIIRIK